MPRPAVYDQALRATLIDAAAAAIAEGGAEALSLRAVATTAGTSTNAVYTLFGSKAELVQAVLAEAERSFGAAQHAVPVTDDVITDLRNLGIAYRAWALAHPTLYEVMFGGRVPFTAPADPGCHPLLPTQVDPAGSITPLIATVTRGLATGVLGGGEVADVVISIWASVHGMVALEIAAGAGRRPEDGSEPGPMDAVSARHLDAIARGWHVR